MAGDAEQQVIGHARVVPTRADVEKLKRDWAKDPGWDLEDTDGFEDYREELREFAAATEAERDAKQKAKVAQEGERLLERAEALGFHSGTWEMQNTVLAAMLVSERLERIASALERIANRSF